MKIYSKLHGIERQKKHTHTHTTQIKCSYSWFFENNTNMAFVEMIVFFCLVFKIPEMIKQHWIDVHSLKRVDKIYQNKRKMEMNRAQKKELNSSIPFIFVPKYSFQNRYMHEWTVLSMGKYFILKRRISFPFMTILRKTKYESC